MYWATSCWKRAVSSPDDEPLERAELPDESAELPELLENEQASGPGRASSVAAMETSADLFMAAVVAHVQADRETREYPLRDARRRQAMTRSERARSEPIQPMGEDAGEPVT